MAALVAVFLTLPEKLRENRKQTLQKTEAKISMSDWAGRGSLDSPRPDDLSRLQDLAVSALIPGAMPSGLAGKNLELLAAELLDESRPLKLRRQAAWNLAKLRSPEAFAILRQCFANAPTQLRATIAETLGNFDGVESKAFLRLLLNSDNEVIVRGAIRGWGALGDSEALQLLSKMLSDQQKGDELRTEAALSLSKINSVHAYQILVDGLNKFADNDLATTILTGLGQRVCRDRAVLSLIS